MPAWRQQLVRHTVPTAQQQVLKAVLLALLPDTVPTVRALVSIVLQVRLVEQVPSSHGLLDSRP